MPELTAKRTLVKSPPELWEELSEVDRLAKHLGAFGEIKITKLDPEHTVAWEGEHASGMVSMEPSGWGTRVTLTAELAADSGEGADSGHTTEADGGEAVATSGTTTDAAGGEPVATVETTTEADGGEPAAGLDPATDVGQTEAAIAREPTAASEPDADPQETVDATRGGTADVERTPPELSTEANEHPPRRRLWSRLVEWLGGDRWERRPASEPYQAAPVPPTLEALIPAAAVPETATAEPVLEKPDEVRAAALRPAEGDPATDHPANEPAPVIDATSSESEETGAKENPGPFDAEQAKSVLERTLDTLGSAHHRPFSRG